MTRNDKLALIQRGEKQLAELKQFNAERAANARLPNQYASLYGWQFEFIGQTATHHECCLIAGNQVGKTLTGTTMDAYHLTGDYPDDYPGHRFDFPPLVWCLGYSMEKTRDLLQTALFGPYEGGAFKGGLIPASRIVSHESASGTVNAMRTVVVKHISGGESKVQFWSYSQGQHALMGDVVDWFHIDEEPRDQTIRPQVLTRTINGDQKRGGRGIYTFTPENGRTDLVIQFLDHPSRDQFTMTRGWDDAPHMTEEKRFRLLAQYPAYQREMRSKGVPMLGHGRIFDMSEDDVMCDPFEIPAHWKVICGLDFGWDHPHALAKLAIDLDTDTVYITHSYKRPKQSASELYGVSKKWAKGVPVAWPADGLQHEKGARVANQTKTNYQDAEFRMLAEHATWPDGGVSVETGIYEMNQRFINGTLKIFRGQSDLMEEWRMYHRDDNGHIVKVKDDILAAVRYAYMMRRYGKAAGEIGVQTAFIPPKPRQMYDRTTRAGR